MLEILVCLKCNLKLFLKNLFILEYLKMDYIFVKNFHLGLGLSLKKIVSGIGLGLGFDICGLDYITGR